jgi:hypothetical protein
MLRRLARSPAAWTAVALLTAGAVFGLYWFQPWKLFTDEQVNEVLSTPAPVATAPPSSAPDGSGSGPAGAPEDSPRPPGPALVAEGDFISHEHTTTGTARVIRNPDGTYHLELVDLDTSNGPDLRVWLTDQPVLEGEAGWHVFDDGEYIELGHLKGNVGNQVYEFPGGADPGDFTSVSIWCKRFAVSFGAATLRS